MGQGSSSQTRASFGKDILLNLLDNEAVGRYLVAHNLYKPVPPSELPDLEGAKKSSEEFQCSPQTEVSVWPLTIMVPPQKLCSFVAAWSVLNTALPPCSCMCKQKHYELGQAIWWESLVATKALSNDAADKNALNGTTEALQVLRARLHEQSGSGSLLNNPSMDRRIALLQDVFQHNIQAIPDSQVQLLSSSYLLVLFADENCITLLGDCLWSIMTLYMPTPGTHIQIFERCD